MRLPFPHLRQWISILLLALISVLAITSFTPAQAAPRQTTIISSGYITQNTGSATLHHVVIEYGGDPIKAPGLVHVREAALDLRNSVLRHSGRAGLIVSGTTLPVTVQDSEFNDNAGDAVHFVLALEVDPVLRNLKASGNGANGVVLFFAYLGGFTGEEGNYVLEEMGLPYLVSGDLNLNSVRRSPSNWQVWRPPDCH